MELQSNKPYRLAEFVTLKFSKARAAREAAEFSESCRRAESKGRRAHELLHACLPDPALVRLWSKDYEVKA